VTVHRKAPTDQQSVGLSWGRGVNSGGVGRLPADNNWVENQIRPVVSLFIVPPFVKCLRTLESDPRHRRDTGELFARQPR